MGTDIQLPLGLRQFRAEELSALLLRQLKEDAEAWLPTRLYPMRSSPFRLILMMYNDGR
jgi:hypothetical protein